jgi:hypothetical protein
MWQSRSMVLFVSVVCVAWIVPGLIGQPCQGDEDVDGTAGWAQSVAARVGPAGYGQAGG